MKPNTNRGPNDFAFMLGVIKAISGYNMHHEEFANQCGISPDLLTMIEKGKCRPSGETMKNICTNLEMDLEVATKMLTERYPGSIAKMFIELHPHLNGMPYRDGFEHAHCNMVFTTLRVFFQIDPATFLNVALQTHPLWAKDCKSAKEIEEWKGNISGLFEKIADYESEDRNTYDIEHSMILFKACGLLDEPKDGRFTPNAVDSYEKVGHVITSEYVEDCQRYGSGRCETAKAIAQYMIDRGLA